MQDLYLLHRFLRKIASLACQSFFHEIHVIGSEYIPQDGPVIVVATHHNMMLDPAVLSSGFPGILHYWSKASLYANPIVKEILLSTGNIPVDRKSSDRRVLLKGTFETLAKGEVVALFPEGTSYTEPSIAQVKDGASWALLEYCKWAKEGNLKGEFVEPVILPAAMVYTNKSKYRSSAILEYSKPIPASQFLSQFLSSEPDAPKAAVKALTRTVERAFHETTVNAPDWDTLYSARMVRDILWVDERSIDLDEFVVISQTLVDLFTTPHLVPDIKDVQIALLEYYSLLQATHLSHSVLSNLPLPKTLDPKQQNISMPSRLYTVALLIKDTLSLVIRLPFFVFPLLVHFPVYFMAKFGAGLVRDEEESQAQNKVIFGVLAMFMAYPTAFFFFWALFFFTPFAAVVAAGLVTVLAYYHTTMIDDNYEHAKRLIAAWRVLVGVWAPSHWEFPIHAMSQYITPITPLPNPWLDKYKDHAEQKKGESNESLKSSDTIPAMLPSGPQVVLPGEEEPPASISKTGHQLKRRPPSRRIMRHVLRARVKAIRAVSQLFTELGRQDKVLKSKGQGKKRVYASEHLGARFGGLVDVPTTPHAETVRREGWRDYEEVVEFLRKRGAKIPSPSASKDIGDDWATLSSDGELTTDNE
ncbi:glycerol-3-phosphate-acyltransferase [Flagelloscypha sp. PMI_526]|nr:glycerol-3-phosphate-acyltransferase [Flagelloscypha sp. PMI_526]